MPDSVEPRIDIRDLNPPVSPEELFALRYAIARIGEWDWLQWWESSVLGSSGQYAAPRLFSRTTRLSCAHLAILAAASRHAAVMPLEPMIHLFDLGGVFERRFERWLALQKAEGWEPSAHPERPNNGQSGSVASALEAVGLGESEAPEGASSGRKSIAVGAIASGTLSDRDDLRWALDRLVGAYRVSSPGQFVAPYLRLQRP